MTRKWNNNRIIPVTALLAVVFGAASFIIVHVNDNRRLKMESESKNKFYVCSMEPQIIRDRPGDCPICGMALIEKKDFEENYADSRLNDVVRPVNESVLASVRTISPAWEELPLVVEASGIINYDSRAVKTVSANFRGLIERSYVKYNFQPIKKGQKIYDIYCPEIYTQRANYINLMKKYPDQPEMTVDARNWLVQQGLTDEQIKQISSGEKPNLHLTVYSQVEGFVVSADFDPEESLEPEEGENVALGISSASNRGIGLSEGVMVEAGAPLFKVVDTKSVRADLKVRNDDATFLRIGQKVILSDVVNPKRKLKATISLIEPLNGGLFQLVRVYLTDNENLLLPGMKIHAYIEAGEHTSLWVAKSAITDLGLQKAVFVLEDSTFVATAVHTGLRSGDKVEIISGVSEDAVIADNASLLTDSDGLIKTITE